MPDGAWVAVNVRSYKNPSSLSRFQQVSISTSSTQPFSCGRLAVEMQRIEAAAWEKIRRFSDLRSSASHVPFRKGFLDWNIFMESHMVNLVFLGD